MAASNTTKNATTDNTASDTKPTIDRPSVVVRFAGDSGDGMQLAGTQFTDTSAIFGNDVATLPDFPAEIRAPAGTVAGVSGFQINFASQNIFTPGDRVNALIAMNPAALKAHLSDVEPGGIVIVNEDEFDKVNLKKAGYDPNDNPLDHESLSLNYQLFKVPITRLNNEALEDSGLNAKQIARCKNMFALGIVYWLFGRTIDTTARFLNQYFAERKNLPDVAEANVNALKSGYFFGETAEIFPARYRVHKADIKSGKYRKITGNDALATGLIAASKLADKQLIYCSYPITPASSILHYLAGHRHFGVKTFQAEDEIAAVCAAIGATFAGQLGVTGTSGPGLALKGEAMGLAVMTELPLVVVNVQRGGPSTGLPTKTEQSDLLQALFGRSGDCPMIVLAAQSPADCFHTAIEAVQLATSHMTPVLILTDGYLANGSEPWRIPSVDSLKNISISHPAAGETSSNGSGDNGHSQEPSDFEPYARNERLTRPWAIPGTEGLEHRLGGLEKAHRTGNVSYDPENHQFMTLIRKEKVDRVASELPPLETYGNESGKLLVLGWGGTYGSIHTAVDQALSKGQSVAAAHLRYMNPMPSNVADVLGRFERVLVPELNTGQLRWLIRGRFNVDARGINKIQGRPFLVEELGAAIDLMLGDGFGEHDAYVAVDGSIKPTSNAYDFIAGPPLS